MLVFNPAKYVSQRAYTIVDKYIIVYDVTEYNNITIAYKVR